MKKNVYKISLAVITLMVVGGMAAVVQSKTQYSDANQTTSAQTGKKWQKPMSQAILEKNTSNMMSEPHQVLARAFMQNIGTFAKTLSDQAQGGNSLSADFARAAVSEISRNFDEANTHNQEHMKTMRPGRPSRLSGMPEMGMRDSKLKNAIDTLENDVQNYTMNSKQIVADCADVLKHLDEMSKAPGQE